MDTIWAVDHVTFAKQTVFCVSQIRNAPNVLRDFICNQMEDVRWDPHIVSKWTPDTLGKMLPSAKNVNMDTRS